MSSIFITMKNSRRPQLKPRDFKSRDNSLLLLGLEGASYTPFIDEIEILNLPPSQLALANGYEFISMEKKSPKDRNILIPFVECMEAMRIIDADDAYALVCRALFTWKGNAFHQYMSIHSNLLMSLIFSIFYSYIFGCVSQPNIFPLSSFKG